MPTFGKDAPRAEARTKVVLCGD
jgi:small GTP-binding protein